MSHPGLHAADCLPMQPDAHAANALLLSQPGAQCPCSRCPSHAVVARGRELTTACPGGSAEHTHTQVQARDWVSRRSKAHVSRQGTSRVQYLSQARRIPSLQQYAPQCGRSRDPHLISTLYPRQGGRDPLSCDPPMLRIRSHTWYTPPPTPLMRMILTWYNCWSAPSENDLHAKDGWEEVQGNELRR